MVQGESLCVCAKSKYKPSARNNYQAWLHDQYTGLSVERLVQNNQHFETCAAAGSSDAAVTAGVLTHHQDVIVNGLGNTHNVADHAVLLTLGLYGCCSSIAAIAAHYKHHVNAPHVYPLHNLPADVHVLLFNSSHGLNYSLLVRLCFNTAH